MISLDVFRLGWHLTKYNLLSTPTSIASVLFQLRFSQSRSRASPKRNNWRDGKGAGSTVPDQINLHGAEWPDIINIHTSLSMN